LLTYAVVIDDSYDDRKGAGIGSSSMCHPTTKVLHRPKGRHVPSGFWFITLRIGNIFNLVDLS